MNDRSPLLEAFPPVPTDAWEDAIRADLRGADYDKTLLWRTLDGFEVRPYYRREDLAGLSHRPEDVVALMPSSPGGAANTWRIRQDVPAVGLTAAAHARAAVEGGVTDLGLPAGLALRTAADLARILNGIDLSTVAVHLAAGPGAVAAATRLLLEAAAQGGVEPGRLRGSVEDDVLARLAADGAADVEAGIAALAGALRDPVGLTPDFKLVTAGAEPYHAGGASLAQETGCLLAAASEYLARLTDAGVPAEEVAGRLQFVVPVGASYFAEVARLRAVRLLWAQLFAAFAPGAAAVPVTIQAVTSGWNQTVYDPHVNLLRGTTEAAAAVVGGCDVLAVRPFDAPLHTPDAFSLHLARNVQLVLMHEAALDRVRDAGAGAYYLEVLTDRIGAAAWSFFQEIEARGGLVAALREGFVQASIAATRQQREKDLLSRRRVLVGTNNYPNAAERRLDELAPAGDGAPDAATDARPIPTRRAAEPFEALRLATERAARASGRTPAVFLFPIGHPAMRTTRATFAANFFGCAGFEIQDHVAFDTIAAGIEAIRREQPDVVVLCSSDEEYATFAPALCDRLREAGLTSLVVVAGAPEGMDALRAAGVDDFIHRKSPLLETLRAYQQRLATHEVKRSKAEG